MATATSVDLVERLRAERVTSLDQLYDINGVPHESIVNKHTSYLTPLLEEFITSSPVLPHRHRRWRGELRCLAEG